MTAAGPPLPPEPPTSVRAGSEPGAVTTVRVRHVAIGAARGGGGPDREGPDDVAVEAPLELRFAGTAATVLLRTPGDDDDLVHGFLLGEGIVRSAADLVHVARPAGLPPGEAGNVVDVTLVPALADAHLDRGLYSSSACGACGKRSLASLEVHAAPLAPGPRVPRAVLASLPDRLRAAQPAFARTGGLHACGLFAADGALVALREDVGRHNAVDKVVGWALRAGRVPLAGHVLVVSGRISYELAQKAVVAGAPVLVAVGAPSSLAIDVARAHGLTLVGFTRATSFNVYAGPERVGD